MAAEPMAGGTRRIAMTRVTRLLISFALATSTAACAASAPTADTANGPTAPTGPTSAGASAPVSGPPETTCGNHVVADESASGTTVCLAVGGDLIVLLHSDVTGSTWSEPQIAGSSLGAGTGTPTPSDAVGWLFKALAAGPARITSLRSDCPPASPGTVACDSVLVFQLQVEVR
jgi:hypothetical protein